MKSKILFLSFSLLILYSCSSSENTTQQNQKKEPQVYVFDDVSKIDSIKTEVPQQPATQEIKEPEAVKTSVQSFVVQVGAFTSKEKAEAFVKENQSKIKQKMEISFSTKVQLYVIQLPFLASREDAEKLRNELWKIPSFKDAFIITVDGQQ